MRRTLSIRLSPQHAHDEKSIRDEVSKSLGISNSRLTAVKLLKRSLDARKKPAFYLINVEALIDEAAEPVVRLKPLPDVSRASKSVIIIGAGPAGLFAALQLIKLGIKPLIIERGKDVKDRRRDLAALNKTGIINPESNYCFGEGGAGTYSDGKLYTRSNKRGSVAEVLDTFVRFGADAEIALDAHPHIGTNKLPQIIVAMRQAIIAAGGEVHFNKKLTSIKLTKDKVSSVETADGDQLKADAYLLATGHSARDIFHLLHSIGLQIEAKPFALGVRIEHPQSLINNIQYHGEQNEFLPPASYSLVQQVDDRGVFSFCMCPGGIIAPASTSPGELVVNGWSPSRRNNPFANSGMVVQVEAEDAAKYLRTKKKADPFLFMHLQQNVEQRSFNAGGGAFKAPAQRVIDFTKGIISQDIPKNSYLPGTSSADLHDVLPAFISTRLAEGIKMFGKKLRGYYTNEAIVVATESRTSSPIRIPREAGKLHHQQATNLFPCGEGAGYAGGIVSAAIDGINVADAIAKQI